MANLTTDDFGDPLVEDFDENEFRKVVWEMYLLEVLWRAKGNELEADRIMNLRVRLKGSVGIETTYKEEPKPSE